MWLAFFFFFWMALLWKSAFYVHRLSHRIKIRNTSGLPMESEEGIRNSLESRCVFSLLLPLSLSLELYDHWSLFLYLLALFFFLSLSLYISFSMFILLQSAVVRKIGSKPCCPFTRSRGNGVLRRGHRKVKQIDWHVSSAYKMCKCYVGLAAVNIPQFLHLTNYICFEAFCKNSVLNRWQI